MTVGRSKRRSFLTLTFLVKSVCKNLLIRTYALDPKKNCIELCFITFELSSF